MRPAPIIVFSTVPKGVADALTPAWQSSTVLFDALYHPWPTPLAAGAAAAGCRIVSGLDLLLYQAARQFDRVHRRGSGADSRDASGTARRGGRTVTAVAPVNSAYLPVPARVATTADIDAIVATMTTAFFHDPMWGPAFPDATRRAEQAAALWRLFVTSSMRYPWMLVTENVEAAALWIPPGGTELTHEEETGFEDFLLAQVDRRVADGILAIFELLEDAHPSEPHYYLSLLGTHDAHRGKQIGMGLLTENLARIDALGAPAYLESCNPANNVRYARAGFVAKAEIVIPSGHVVTTMWRPAR